MTVTDISTTCAVVIFRVINNSPILIQDYVHPHDETQPSKMTPGFKTFTAIVQYSCKLKSHLISKLENFSGKFQCRFFIVMITGMYSCTFV